MKLKKLFGVLVIGGATLALTGCTDDSDGRDGPLTGATDASAELDGNANAADAAGTTGTGADAGMLEPCFCDVQACCTRDDSGAGALQVGFECCWTTTC